MKEIISTIIRGREIELVWRPEEDEINGYIKKGFIPIEMAEGLTSYVDSMTLDHHNGYSNLPSACVTALEYYNAAKSPVKIMANHTDMDCVLAGATIIGLIPLDILKRLNPEVGIIDTDPMSVNIDDLEFGDFIRLWKLAMMSAKNSGWSWLYGLQMLVDIYEGFANYSTLRSKLADRERERVALAMEDIANAVVGKSGKVAMITPSRVFGFDVQYQRNKDFPIYSLDGWKFWCLCGYVEKSGNITISCPNKEVAEEVFGRGGLTNVFPKLPMYDNKEWGGREAVGGSPRGIVVPLEDVDEILNIIDNLVPHWLYTNWDNY